MSTTNTSSTATTVLHILSILMLAAVCYGIFFAENVAYNSSRTQYLEDEMKIYQRKFDSVLTVNNALLTKSYSAQDSLLKAIDKIDLTIKITRKNVENEKAFLENASNDENAAYFSNYIRTNNK